VARGAAVIVVGDDGIEQRAADPARVQLRADLWSALAGEPATRERFAATVRRQRIAVRELIKHGIQAGELAEVPANALRVSVMLGASGR
jgi:hypothetical protein